MKNIAVILILNIMFANLQAQVYNERGKKISCVAEDIDITFQESIIRIPEATPEKDAEDKNNKEISPAMAAIAATAIPALVNAGYKVADSLFAKNVRQYEAVYQHSQSYLNAGQRKMPDITIERRVWKSDDHSAAGETALKFVFKASEVPDLSGVMVYYIDSIEQQYTKIRIKKNDRPDYSIVLSLVFLKQDGNPVYDKPLQLNPITVRSSKFSFSRDVSKDRKYRTDIFVLPPNAFLTKVSIEIIETNPRKIAAEKILAAWATYKEDLRTGLTVPLVEQATNIVNKTSEDDEQWRIAKAKNSKESFQEYLNKYPEGRHADDAKNGINKLEKSGNEDNNTSVGND